MNAQGGLQSADAVLHRAAERLAQQFTGMVGEETVERVVFESYTRRWVAPRRSRHCCRHWQRSSRMTG